MRPALAEAAVGSGGDTALDPQDIAFSPGGNLLAAVTYHGTVLVYNLADPARPARTATVRGLLTRALYPNGSAQPDETPLCATCGPANYAVAFASGGHTLTVVVDREEMSANSGRDTIFDWPVTGSGALGAVTATARDVADFQPFIAPDRTVLGSPCWAARATATPGMHGRCRDPFDPGAAIAVPARPAVPDATFSRADSGLLASDGG